MNGRGASSSVVERSIAARRVTGSNPVLRSFFFPFLPRSLSLSLSLYLSICLAISLSVGRSRVLSCSFRLVWCRLVFRSVASFGGSVDAIDDVDGPRLRLGSL